MRKVIVKSITPQKLDPLREAWLVVPGIIAGDKLAQDDRSSIQHLGAISRGKIIGVVSVYNEPRPAMVEGKAWRMRNLAVLPALRNEKIGTALIDGVSRFVSRRCGSLIWAHVPVEGCEFFRALGFDVVGDSFEVKGLAPHHRILLKPKSR
ncbi:MAG: ribosomal protein S18 acetylase RimI-like enzyme [Myxococcota bacterium]|jgi:ribosomal protein S18 acetylase RimI-like enzyme